MKFNCQNCGKTVTLTQAQTEKFRGRRIKCSCGHATRFSPKAETAGKIVDKQSNSSKAIPPRTTRTPKKPIPQTRPIQPVYKNGTLKAKSPMLIPLIACGAITFLLTLPIGFFAGRFSNKNVVPVAKQISKKEDAKPNLIPKTPKSPPKKSRPVQKVEPQKVEPQVDNATPVRPLPLKVTDPDFRNIRWGMSRKEVIASESIELEAGERTLFGSVRIAGLDSYVVYIFAEDKLVRAKYSFTERHSNKNDYLSDFQSIRTSLLKKYGTPEDHTFWTNDLYKDDRQDYGMAVAAGHMEKYSIWEIERQQIILSITGDNYDIKNSVEYSSNEFDEFEDRTVEAENQKDF